MPTDDYVLAAELCRREAGRYAQRAEGPFLLRLAEAYDDLSKETHADYARTEKVDSVTRMRSLSGVQGT
jgi:hypothetical protein